MIASIYIFFGMAILAMCFDLIQEGLITKFTLIGEKVGIIKKDQDEEDEKIREEVFDSGETDEAALREKLKLQEQINNRTSSRVSSSMMVTDGGRASFVMSSNDFKYPQQQQQKFDIGGEFKEPNKIFIKPSTSQGSYC